MIFTLLQRSSSDSPAEHKPQSQQRYPFTCQFVVCLCCSLLTLLGCAGAKVPIGSVAGKVLYQDQPVTPATIIFQHTTSAQAYTALLGAQGEFKLSTHENAGLPTGTYRVAVKPKLTSSEAPPLVGSEGPATTLPAVLSFPKKYYSVETSELHAEVHAGANEPLVFVLK